MLKQNGKDVQLHGFLVGVELEPGVDAIFISERLAGALTFIEGVGEVDTEHLGIIEVLDESTVTTEEDTYSDETFLAGATKVLEEELN